VRREYSVGCDGKLAIYVGEVQVWTTVVVCLITMSRCSSGGLSGLCKTREVSRHLIEILTGCPPSTRPLRNRVISLE